MHIQNVLFGIEDFLLLGNAILVGLYFLETKRLRVAAQDQVTIAQKQVSESHAQLEAQIRPALAVRWYGDLKLVNVGNGAAVNLRMIHARVEATVGWDSPANIGSPSLRGAYVAVQEFDSDPTKLKGAAIPGGFFQQNPGTCLQLVYESLSGKTYASVIEFAADGNIARTRFETR
jgi:hypothetical protein